MNSWKSRFSMLLLKWAAATFLKRTVASSARGLWDPLWPAGAGPGASGRSPTPRLGGAAARVQTARRQPVLGGLRGAGRRLGLTPRSAPPRVLLNRTEPQFLTVCTVSRRVTGGKRRVDPRRGSGRPRRQPRRLGSLPLASAGPASALPSHFSRPATRCLSWESLKRGSQVYLLRVTPGQAIVLVGACYPIPGS